MNIYIDNEWYIGGRIFLHSYATDISPCYQLWGSLLTRENIIKSLNIAKNAMIFIYGPDIGMIERDFKIKIKQNFTCINLHRVFKYQLPKRSSYKLAGLEYDFGIKRNVKKYKQNIHTIGKDFHNSATRQAVLQYNREDVINLRILKEIIFKEYPISKKELLTMRLN
jgi:RNase_H superfamily